MITVVRAGPLTTVQDLGRPGWAHLGVPRSGALDPAALASANRLVGNPDSAAGLETTLLGCAVRCARATVVAVTGAPATVSVDGVPAVFGTAVVVPAGSTVEVGRALAGVRSYLAVAGGIDVEAVLGSRSTDTLSGLGPPRLATGMSLPIGPQRGEPKLSKPGPELGGANPELGGPAESAFGKPGADLVLEMRFGPRDDWFVGLADFLAATYTISPVSNRIGARLTGPALTRARPGELPSEGVVLGAIQVPTDGHPLVFLADHPTTGGYPVIGVVDDVTPLAQARPGTTVRFHGLDSCDGSQR